MNKGICFHFGYVYEHIEQQVRDIQNAGFDCVMTCADKNFNKENGTIKKQVKLFKKYKLKLSSLHMRYKRQELPEFWKNSKVGKKIEKDLINDVKIAAKYGFTCVVVHLYGEPNEVGINRLNRVLKVCEKKNVPLALENLNKNFNLLKFCFNNIKSNYLKVCFDSGHQNCFEPEIDHLTIFKDRIIALHLHDNLGENRNDDQVKGFKIKKETTDMHTLNKYGNINWNKIAEKLSKVNNEINIDYEVMMVYRKNETSKEVLFEVNKQADELIDMIEKYKGK